MYGELVRLLKDKAECFDYDGWVDTAILMSQAAEAIEELLRSEAVALENLADEHNRRLALEQRYRWIPVEERLPEEDGDYLVWFSDAACHKVAEFSKHTAKERHVWWFAGIDRTRFVTHWMPLPEPPEEGI